MSVTLRRLAGAPRPVSVDGLSGFEHAAGVTEAVIQGRDHIARFLLLTQEQLKIGD